ncbi:MAG: hypothetical protein K6L73_09855 [Cellvibrionaceae bacterium]
MASTPIDNTQFFYRTVVFTRKDGQVALADIHEPANTTPLDEWLGIVVSLADGRHTLEQLLEYLSSRYPMPPNNLQETVNSVVERLLEGKLIQLSDKPVELPYYLAEPVEELNLKEAQRLVKEDGYTAH